MNPLFLLADLAGRLGDRLESIGSIEAAGGGFSGATVLKTHCRGGAFAVRGWPEGTDPGRVRALHSLLRHVAGRGIPLAVPLSDARGDTLFRHEGRWWHAEPWLPGRADLCDSPTDAKLAAAAIALAGFHEATASFEPAPDAGEWFDGPAVGPAPAVRDRLVILRRYAEDDAASIRIAVACADGEFAGLAARALRGFDRLAGVVEAELRFAGTLDVPLAPCLRDVRRDHVLFSGEEVTGLIDPSACRRDTVATDLSRLLGDVCGRDRRGWDAAVAAYRRRRTLTDSELALIPVLHRSGVLLSAMTWLRRRYLLGVPCETPAVLCRLRETVGRIEHLDPGV